MPSLIEVQTTVDNVESAQAIATALVQANGLYAQLVSAQTARSAAGGS